LKNREGTASYVSEFGAGFVYRVGNEQKRAETSRNQKTPEQKDLSLSALVFFHLQPNEPHNKSRRSAYDIDGNRFMKEQHAPGNGKNRQ